MLQKTGRRKLNRQELRLILFADAYQDDNADHQHALHVVRQTVKGQKITACHIAQKLFADDLNYWDFPVLNFLLHHAPICVNCRKVLNEEGVY